jgi:hypothetical protein
MAENTTGTRAHKAGLFDIRFIIGSLIGVYGVITLLTGVFASSSQIDKSDGVNINLYGGIGMLVVAAFFGVWARLRPIVVPEEPVDDGDDTDRPAGH